MNVLVTGGGGQLASALEASCPGFANIDVLSIDQLDITNERVVLERICDARPEVIINCAAYTAVDQAETDETMARAVNCDGARHLARAAAKIKARLVHPSTDFVFDGSGSTPWKPGDAPNPLSVYGKTKLEGERAVLEEIPEQSLVVRTAWVYSKSGVNFVNTMLRHMHEQKELRVVADQVGTPTWARKLAEAIWCMVDRDLKGIHHWTDLGTTTWYEFAVVIADLATELGILERMPRIEPISSAEFPTPARRPLFSVLDKTATWTALDGTDCIPPRNWRDNLATMMTELAGA